MSELQRELVDKTGSVLVAEEVSKRVTSILEAVEKEAARLREEARDEARRYMEYAKRRADGLVAERQRRIAELSDSMLRNAEAVLAKLEGAQPVRAGFEDLVRSLGDAAERLAEEVGTGDGFDAVTLDEPAGRAPVPVQPPQMPAPDAEPAPAPEPDAGLAAHAGAMPVHTAPASAPEAEAPPEQHDPAPTLVAIQMAADGSTRGEVETHLRNLSSEDPAPVLDRLFGAGTAGDAHVPWTNPQEAQE